jgi:hypothetical protein
MDINIIVALHHTARKLGVRIGDEDHEVGIPHDIQTNARGLSKFIFFGESVVFLADIHRSTGPPQIRHRQIGRNPQTRGKSFEKFLFNLGIVHLDN